MKELTRETLDELIDKIIVSNVKNEENKREILIHFNFIGNL